MRPNPSLAGFLLVAVLAGCGKPTGDSSVPSSANDPTIVAPDQQPQTAAAPAALPIATDSPPEVVVAAFLNALRDGNDQVTEQLLSDIARTETAKHELTVQPPGTPTATYQIGDVRLVPGGAHVHSTWSEKFDDGTDASYEIVWVLRQQPDGWRIAGMATEIEPGQPAVFLNFEDPADMLAKWKQSESAPAAGEAQPAAIQASEQPATQLR